MVSLAQFNADQLQTSSGHLMDLPAQVDLPAVLGVDLIHCEKQAQQAIQSSNGSLQRIQGDLITLSYFDSLAAEVNETLKARLVNCTMLPIGALARNLMCTSPLQMTQKALNLLLGYRKLEWYR